MTATKRKPRRTAVGSNGHFDFGLDELEVAGKVRRLEMPMVSPDAYLLLVSTHDNPQYEEMLIRQSALESLKVGEDDEDPVEKDARELAFERERYARTIVKGWGGIRQRGSNAQVPFTLEASLAFFQQIPKYLFNRVRAFCLNTKTFNGSGSEAELDPRGLAKN